MTWADFKQSKELKKNDGAKRQRLTGITKLDDANDAGGRYSDDCTLILTEGDSAKALAVLCSPSVDASVIHNCLFIGSSVSGLCR